MGGRERKGENAKKHEFVCVCVCVCVKERETTHTHTHQSSRKKGQQNPEIRQMKKKVRRICQLVEDG